MRIWYWSFGKWEQSQDDKHNCDPKVQSVANCWASRVCRLVRDFMCSYQNGQCAASEIDELQ